MPNTDDPNWTQKFWSKVDKKGPIHPVLKTRCWIWKGPIMKPGGYGQFVLNGRTRTAHWISYCMEHGKVLPEGIFALHRCDVRLCVNPGHLFEGTPQDNAVDMAKKARGSGQKLTPQKVREIVIGLRSGISTQVLADVYKVTRQTISDINRGYTWSHSNDNNTQNLAETAGVPSPGGADGGAPGGGDAPPR